MVVMIVWGAVGQPMFRHLVEAIIDQTFRLSALATESEAAANLAAPPIGLRETYRCLRKRLRMHNGWALLLLPQTP